MTTQADTLTEAPEPVAPVVADQAPIEQPPATPATPPVAAAPETPAPVIPAPIVPAAPAVDPRLQEYLTSVERQNRELQVRLDQEASVTAIARRQEALVDDGLPLERAQAIATEIVQARQQGQTQVNELQAKVDYAIQLGEQSKVSVKALMQYNSPEAMRQAVDRLAAEGSQAAEIARLKTEVANLKKGAVPAQTFDSGRGAGGPVANSDNVDALWVAFDREHPNEKNPYDTAYSRLLRSL